MKFKASEGFLNENTIYLVLGIGVNNYTKKSRDILKEMKEFKGKLINVNPVTNFFNLFLKSNDLDGVFGDLESLNNSEIDLELLKSSKISNSSRDVFLKFSFLDRDKGGCEQGVDEFAKQSKSFFDGSWKVYVFDRKSNTLKTSYRPRRKRGDRVGNKGIQKRRGQNLGLIDKNTMLYCLSEKVRKALLDTYRDIELPDGLLLSFSSNLSFGDFSSNIAFVISEKVAEDRQKIATEIAMNLGRETTVFKEVVCAKNGFINFFLNEDYLCNTFLQKGSLHSIHLPENKNIVIESPSANPNKQLQVGHLLNLFLSRSLTAIYSKIGFEIFNDNIINDKGLPICKTIWAIQNFAMDSSPEKEKLKPDHFVGKYYVIGNKAFEEDKKIEEEIRQILVGWEAGDKEIIKLWKKLINWALEGQTETIQRLGEEMGHMWFESDIYDKGREVILNSLDGKKIVKTKDGAVIGKLEEEYGVADVVLLKSDGTSLYHTQDVYLTKLKIEKFAPFKAIWVVGSEQIVHFQKLFSVIDMIGLLSIDNLYHLAYGFVFDKEGKKMASRTGEALSADELLEMVKKAVLNLKKDIDDIIAEKVAIGALKYSFLASDPFKDMKFDLERAVMFNGKSGPYIMYAYARANNILNKIDDKEKKLEGKLKLSSLEKEIILKCLDYNNVILASANNYSPSILAEYLYDIAKLFNQMYETESVLNAEGNEFLIRIAIVERIKYVLGDGLSLLRIEPLESM